MLQAVRWGTGDTSNPEDVIAQINTLGYGLTLGIQTRIDSRAQALAAAAHVGHSNINRNMIDAVVGCAAFWWRGGMRRYWLACTKGAAAVLLCARRVRKSLANI